MASKIKRVLITGGAGTLGRAFCKLLIGNNIEVIAVDHSELALVELKQELPQVDIKLASFDEINFDLLPPLDYVLHLAAFKHVVLGERDPESFIDNNINRTSHLFAETKRRGINTMFMSTDKAVEPISVYGYTKAIGEALAREHGYPIARCGNIINSTGSVVPIWEKQIAAHKPLSVTNSQMARYIIKADDAASAIWQQLLAGKKLLVPTKIRELTVEELALETLQRHGFKTLKDYQPGLKTIGANPAEKQREKLFWDFE